MGIAFGIRYGSRVRGGWNKGRLALNPASRVVFPPYEASLPPAAHLPDGSHRPSPGLSGQMSWSPKLVFLRKERLSLNIGSATFSPVSWGKDLTSGDLSFLICKMGIMPAVLSFHSSWAHLKEVVGEGRAGQWHHQLTLRTGPALGAISSASRPSRGGERRCPEGDSAAVCLGCSCLCLPRSSAASSSSSPSHINALCASLSKGLSPVNQSLARIWAPSGPPKACGPPPRPMPPPRPVAPVGGGELQVRFPTQSQGREVSDTQ